LPAVVGRRDNGDFTLVLDDESLSATDGSVSGFYEILTKALQSR
jgi:hypothetical protein